MRRGGCFGTLKESEKSCQIVLFLMRTYSQEHSLGIFPVVHLLCSLRMSLTSTRFLLRLPLQTPLLRLQILLQFLLWMLPLTPSKSLSLVIPMHPPVIVLLPLLLVSPSVTLLHKNEQRSGNKLLKRI
jgi:hypothetical protein